MGLKFSILGGFKEENMKDECWDPLGNQSPPKHVIQCKECGDTPKILHTLARKVKKEENNPIAHNISPLCPTDHAGPIWTIFGT